MRVITTRRETWQPASVFKWRWWFQVKIEGPSFPPPAANSNFTKHHRAVEADEALRRYCDIDFVDNDIKIDSPNSAYTHHRV